MTTHWCCTMRIQTSLCENIWIFYNIIFVNRLQFSATFCGHLQGSVFSNIILQKQLTLAVFGMYPSKEHLPEDGYKMWQKYVGNLQ
jgi:hypothetical protein